MFSKSLRGIYFSSSQKPSFKIRGNDGKYKGQSGWTNLQKLVFLGILLFLVLWFLELLIEAIGDGPYVDLAQDDPVVVDFVRKNYVFQCGTVKSDDKNGVPQPGLVEYLIQEKLISNKHRGYFVEIGSHDGTGFTSTFSLDRILGWSGLVVEPVPTLFSKMIQVREMNRKKDDQNEILVSSAAISPQPYLAMCELHYNPPVYSGDGVHNRFYKKASSSSMVLCIPLYSLFLAAGVPKRVDLLILDIGGNELDVLKTLPFQNLQISIIVVGTYSDGPTDVQNFLQEKGYKVVGNVKVALGKELIDNTSQSFVKNDTHFEYTVFKLNE